MKCTKIYNASAQLLFFSFKNLLFSDVLVVVVVVVCLSSLKSNRVRRFYKYTFVNVDHYFIIVCLKFCM